MQASGNQMRQRLALNLRRIAQAVAAIELKRHEKAEYNTPLERSWTSARRDACPACAIASRATSTPPAPHPRVDAARLVGRQSSRTRCLIGTLVRRVGVYSSLIATNNLARVGFDADTATIKGDVEIIAIGTSDFFQLDVTKDGRFVALSTSSRTREDLYVLTVADGSIRQLTNDFARDRWPR